MVTSNQEDLLKYLDGVDIEANSMQSIKNDGDTELANHYGHDNLQDHLVITGIPLIATGSKEEEVGKCEDNEGNASDSSLVSPRLFLRHFACGLTLGSFFVWPAIRICFFYLLTRCEHIGNLFFLNDKEQAPEMPNWLMALYYDPYHASAVWRIIFMVETYVVNIMMMFLFFALCLSKDGCLHKGKLHGVMYSPMVMSIVSTLVLVTMRSTNLHVGLLLIAAPLALVGYALAVYLIAYAICCVVA